MKATLCLWLTAGALTACGPTHPAGGSDAGDDGPGGPDGSSCSRTCSEDGRAVLDCNGQKLVDCQGVEACDVSQGICTNACTAAEANHRSIGCDYYAVHMDSFQPDYCFAVFVANTWTSPAKINVDYRGAALPVASFTRLPVGSGPGLTYAPYNAATGIMPGQVAVLFLGGKSTSSVPCPVPAAVPTANRIGTAVADAFHITTDVPTVAYQISPYGGGAVAVTAASLLLPSSVWDKNYVAVNVSAQASGKPSLNIIAREDGTVATITPRVMVGGGGGVPAGGASQPLNIPLLKGQHAQISQNEELTGSVITSNKPIGLMAGQTCMNMPVGTSFCDHGEQMIPPIHALANKYAGVMYRPRVPSETSTFWRLIGAVDGTELTYSSNVGGPATLSKGQSVLFQTGAPFIVSSQDRDHPFMLFGYMTGSQFNLNGDGFGDPDFVLMVPPEQYLKEYVFFTDPTYPETNLVLVRAKGKDAMFHDVTLDCAGTVGNWRPVGNTGELEFTRVDLSTGNFAPVGNCQTGRHEIKSQAPFGLWVWGWGTPGTQTPNVSYGYPGGMNVTPINDVIIQ